MLPVIAIIGRPNVGKSTLFNALTKTRDALVADIPGLTRDRQYGIGQVGKRSYLLIDTGGLSGQEDVMDQHIAKQVWQAIDESDFLLFMVDARAGLTPSDEEIMRQLRRCGKPIQLVINKSEGLNRDVSRADFYTLGLEQPISISSSHQDGLRGMMDTILAQLPEEQFPDEEENETNEMANQIKLAIVGRPNVGKSTFINRLLGEDRVLAMDMPGTTRDSISIPFERDEQAYQLIDTAGVRRRSRMDNSIEKLSVIKTLQAMKQAHVVVLMLDAHQGIADQDAHLLGHVLDSGRAIVIAINKWDHMAADEREWTKQTLARKLAFIDYASVHFISALHGSGIVDVLKSARKAYSSATSRFSASELTKILEMALHAHQPPLVYGKSIKLRYAHQGGQNPPRIIIHGSRVDHVPPSYQRYLANTFRRQLQISGTPIRIEFRTGENPYAVDSNEIKPAARERKHYAKRSQKKKS